MTSCAGVPEAVSAVGSAAGAWWSYQAATAETVEVLSRDCLFAEHLALNDAAVDALDRQALEQLTLHNRNVGKYCGQEPAPRE